MNSVNTVASWFDSATARVLLSILLIGGTLALLLTDRPVPDVLWALDGATVSFYFAVSIARTANGTKVP